MDTGSSFNSWHPPAVPREWGSALGYTSSQEVQIGAAGWGHSKLRCLETFGVMRRQQEKAVFWRVKGTLHVDEEEFNLLWLPPTLQVSRERPDNKLLDQIALWSQPVINYSQMWRDSQVSESNLGMEKPTSNSKKKYKQGCWEEASASREEMLFCGRARTATLGPRAS